MRVGRLLAVGVAVVLLPVGGLVAAGLVLPDGWVVQQTVVADAEVQDVLPLLRELPRWSDWALVGYAGGELPVITLLDDVEDGGIGAMEWQTTWAGGRVTLVSADDDGVTYVLTRGGRPPADPTQPEAPRPTGEITSTGEIAVVPHPEGVAITWTDHGTVGFRPIGPFLVPFARRPVEENVALGLDTLARLAEDRADFRRRLEAGGAALP